MAEVRKAFPAHLADAATAAKGHRHALTHPPARHAAPEFGDRSGQLVAGDVRQLDGRIVAHPGVPVAAADAIGFDPDDHATLRWRGVGNGLES